MVFQVQDIPGAKPMTPERLKALAPYYHLVPKGMKANIQFRRAILQRAQNDHDFRDVLWQACADDCLFFINVFGWTLDIKDKEHGVSTVPFVTWRSQDQQILEFVEAVGKYDVWEEKSRCQGVTWLIMYVLLWLWLFHSDMVLGVASKEASLVDDSEDPSSLMPKLDFALRWLPEFMKPNYTRVNMKLVNHERHNLIRGYATTEDIARGGRLDVLFLDEFASFGNLAIGVIASSTAVTNCRFFVSTHRGTGAEFYKQTRPDKGKRVLRVHWTTNPRHVKGLYTSDTTGRLVLKDDFNGTVRIEDKEYKFPEDYPFILDGKLRSPYYDSECSRLGQDSVKIAQELDINPEESGANFFPAPLVEKLIADARARYPMHIGDVIADWTNGDFVSFSSNPAGHLKLWAPLDHQGKLPKAQYVLAVDVSTGAGDSMSSNSAISIGNRWTKEKVGELVTAKLTPDRLAMVACAMGRWMAWEGDDAFIIWEENGPGKWFRKRLLELGYSNFYRMRNPDKPGEPSTDKPGWWSSSSAKMTVMGQLRTAYETGTFTNPSFEAIDELRYYVYDPDGGTSHSGTIYCENPTKSKKNHGDRVIADALLWDQLRSRTPGKEEYTRQLLNIAPPEGSLAWRRQERQRRTLEASSL